MKSLTSRIQPWNKKPWLLASTIAFLSCGLYGAELPSFGGDASFLKEHTDAIVLKRDKAAIVVVPEYQGRIMTATAQGDEGLSSGWINYDLVEQGVLPPEQAKGKLDEHMYAFGGEERFWMGPEGGQYAIFFAPGAKFEFADWFTPDPIDNEPWKVVSEDNDQVILGHDFQLMNHSGTTFKVYADRTVKLLKEEEIAVVVKGSLPKDIDAVAYQTINTVTNKGDRTWEKESGLLSIWMLCMFQPSPMTTVFIPHQKGAANKLGKIVNADYFGRVPKERLKVEQGVIYFKADGKARGKIGLTPQRSKGIAASYDPVAKHLTLLLFEQPTEYPGYVNSMWELQEEPYKGDAINSYNDGPVDDSGEQMGPFYELESSSPALALKPEASATHTQTILHLYGSESDLQTVLNRIAQVDLKKVRTAFK